MLLLTLAGQPEPEPEPAPTAEAVWSKEARPRSRWLQQEEALTAAEWVCALRRRTRQHAGADCVCASRHSCTGNILTADIISYQDYHMYFLTAGLLRCAALRRRQRSCR